MAIFSIVLFLALGTLTVNCQSIRQFEVKQYISPVIAPAFTISEIGSNSTSNKYVLDKGPIPFNRQFFLFENGQLLYAVKYDFDSSSQEWTFYHPTRGSKIASIEYRSADKRNVYEFESNQYGKFQFSKQSDSFDYSMVSFGQKIGEIIQTDANKFGTYEIRLLSNQNLSLLPFIAIAIGETVRI